MDRWFELFSSPVCHLVISVIAVSMLLHLPALRGGTKDKLMLAGFICFGWSETIFLSMAYWTEPGYGIIAAIRDSYEDVAPPIVPIVALCVILLLGLGLMAKSSRTRPNLAAANPA